MWTRAAIGHGAQVALFGGRQQKHTPKKLAPRSASALTAGSSEIIAAQPPTAQPYAPVIPQAQAFADCDYENENEIERASAERAVLKRARSMAAQREANS